MPFERVTLSTIDTNHHPEVAKAVATARHWMRRKYVDKAEYASLILIAAPTRNGGKIIHTGRGVGKTHIAKACLHTECFTTPDGKPVAPIGEFFIANNIIHALQQDVPLHRLLKQAKTIVIDQVGAEQRIPYIPNGKHEGEMHNRWARLVDYCYTKRISMILTGNLALYPDLAMHIGFDAWDRLVEMCARIDGMADLTGVPGYRRKLAGE